MLDLQKTLHILPIHLIDPRTEKEQAIRAGEELESLIATLGGTIVDRIMQKMDVPNFATYVGSGKVQEIVEKMQKHHVNIVVLGGMAKPRQIHALKTAFQTVNSQIEVWDRVDLILHIFGKHAVTTEAKLQIELARMRYMGPRIYGMGFVLSRQGGGIGTLGVGETNTELMKRHWRKEIKTVTEKLAKLEQKRKDHLARRIRSGFKTVSIVGYTNAGKSSLFNKLTGKHMLVENALFATLDSTVGEMYMQELQQEVLVTDTIGFIRDLPLRLVDAFASTLMESIHADILLHVIDISDPEYATKIVVVNDVLKSLGRNPTDAIYIFNKMDVAKETDKRELVERYKDNNPLFVSVKNGAGIADLQAAIASRLL